MDPRFRSAFNRSYDEGFYGEFLRTFEARVGCAIPYRVAETPFFIPPALRDRLATHAREIADQVLEPSVVDKMKAAIPKELDVPRVDPLPNCIQVDFAVVQNEDGSLDGRVVELQAFPSLYALMVLKLDAVSEVMAKRMPGLERDWSIFFGGIDRASFVEKLKRAIVADEDPEEVVLLDLKPEQQKTYPDFVATKILVGIDAICPTELTKHGDRLFRKKNGKEIPVRRIYNRVVFDELQKASLELPFRYTEDLDVSWCSHPNWYWIVSKYSLPYIRHVAVPRARTLEELGGDWPEDLSRYVLKPLFSFAGGGVMVDVERADVDAIPRDQRAAWLLQEKITYHPGIPMADGSSNVKAEVRMMFLRAPDQERPELTMNLVRLSRGKMLGVDQNKNLTWVGGSIGIFER
ncbi:MAG: hypothetical protein HOW73_37105 [Polyangiaceae bacterium]|nr:hypothetical protein [Polyangiaceae bacterium]